MTNRETKNQQLHNLLFERKSQSLEEQIAEAGRIVSEIDHINSRKAFELVNSRIQIHNRGHRLLNTLTRVAAVLFIPLLLASIWLFYGQQTPSANVQFAMQEITSPSGVRSQIVLPDGSNVWLNAESTIRFKVPFDSRSRNISLIG